MNNLANVLTSIIDVQDKTVSKLIVDNSAIVSVSGDLKQLSGSISGALSGTFATKQDLENFHTYDNLIHTNKLYVCGNGIAGYETFKQLSNFSTSSQIEDLKAYYYDFSWITDGVAYYTPANDSSKYGVAYTLPTTPGNFEKVACGKDEVYGISSGKLYVIGSYRLSNTATNTSEGSFLGTTLVPSKTEWTQVSTNITNWTFVDSHYGSTVAIAGSNGSGTIYMGGYNQYQILGPAGYDSDGNPQLTKNNTSNVYDTYLLNELKPITLLENNTRITPNDWIKVQKGNANVIAQRSNGKLYSWGSCICGCNGDGVGYWNDMTAAQVSAATSGKYTRAIDFGKSEPEVIKVREYASNYDATSNPDAYTDVEYSDWIDFSHSWYHAVAVRKDASTNKSYVYIWGANEYGQFGNGNYVEASLIGGDIGDSATDIEVKSRPWMLTQDLFPYTDVVKVKATHYGTYLIRENGEIYFAGSNKRNCLGLYSNSSGLGTFITKFTKVSYLGEFDAETYGAIEERSIPSLKDDADSLLQDVLSGQLSPEAIADATVMAHNHTINPSLIDATVGTVSNYVDYLPTILGQSHAHANKTTLGKLSDSNGVLFLDGSPIVAAGSSTGGTTVQVDPSNVKMDNYASILGLTNIAGGYPLEVIAYEPKYTTNEAYMIVGQMRSGFTKDYDRWPAIYKKTVNTSTNVASYASVLASDKLRLGGVGVVYKSTSITSGNILSTILLTSTNSVGTFFSTLNASTNYRGYIYDLAGMGNWSAGSSILSNLTKSSYPYAQLVVKYEGGKIQPNAGLNTTINSDNEYIPLSAFSGSFSNTSHQSDSSMQYIDVYSVDGTLLVGSAVISAGLYYGTGQKVKFAAQLLNVSGYNIIDDESIPVYYSYFNNSALTGTPVIGNSLISGGLYKKVGTGYSKLSMQDALETFDTSLFSVGGQIYVRPSNEDYTGMANQRYEIEAMTSFTTPSTAYSDETLDYMVLKLNSVIVNDNGAPSSLTYTPGLTENPMLALVKSKYRNSTSEVGGEFNAAAGFNAIANGNNNASFGDRAVTYGLCNTNAGSDSFTFGCSNGVTASNSYVFGEANAIAGSYVFVWGNANGNDGQGCFTIGSRNFNSGVNNFIVGTSNELDGNRNSVIGSRNYIAENTNESLIFGNSIYSAADKITAIGWNGEIPKYEGNFPDDTAAITMTASSLQNAITSGTYDSEGLYYKNSFHVCMGDKITNNEDEHLDVLTYTKYKWQVNDAYFALAATSSARSGKEPRLIVPDHRWQFTGKMFMNFTEADLESGSTEDYTVTIRDGGRVKTCDPGLILTDPLEEINFDNGYKFKLKYTGQTSNAVPNLTNWVDGSEGYLIVYGGSKISWPDQATEATSKWHWITDVPSSVAESATSSFVMVKLMVVDETVIATNIGYF